MLQRLKLLLKVVSSLITPRIPHFANTHSFTLNIITHIIKKAGKKNIFWNNIETSEIIIPPAIADPICPDTFALIACINIKLLGSSSLATFCTTLADIGNADTPAAPIIGLIFPQNVDVSSMLLTCGSPAIAFYGLSTLTSQIAPAFWFKIASAKGVIFDNLPFSGSASIVPTIV